MLTEKEKQNITGLCVELHMHDTGSAEYLSQSQIDDRIEFLKNKLTAWNKTSLVRSEAFDEAVKELIRATLKEWETVKL